MKSNCCGSSIDAVKNSGFVFAYCHKCGKTCPDIADTPQARQPWECKSGCPRCAEEYRQCNLTKTVVDLDAPQVGSPRFYELTEKENKLHSEKNSDYAEQGDVWGNFSRVGHIMDYYKLWEAPVSDRAKTAICYMLKQLDCALNSIGKGKELKTEGLEGRFMDISIYSKIILILLEEDLPKQEK